VPGISWNLHPSVTEGWHHKATTLSQLLHPFLTEEFCWLQTAGQTTWRLNDIRLQYCNQ